MSAEKGETQEREREEIFLCMDGQIDSLGQRQQRYIDTNTNKAFYHLLMMPRVRNFRVIWEKI